MRVQRTSIDCVLGISGETGWTENKNRDKGFECDESRLKAEWDGVHVRKL